MPLRTRIIIMVSAGIFVVGAISVFLIFKFGKKPVSNTPVNPNITNNQGVVPTSVKVGTEPTVVPKNVKVAPPTSVQLEDITVKNLAKIFIERYHTYSSENNFQNIRDIESIVTASYWKKISSPIDLKTPPPANFVSLTTEVVGISSVKVNTSEAEVSLSARKTSTSNGKTTTAYTEYAVSLVKIAGNWLVSGESVK